MPPPADAFQPAPDALTRRLRIRHLAPKTNADNFADDVRRGLSAERKRLFPKYFYDELGSELFEAICLLPEYYLTRAENEILTRDADEIVGALGDARTSLLEFGSGSAVKTRSIIGALLRRQPDGLLYTPVDISATALEQSARVLLQSYPALGVAAYAGDYDSALAHVRENVGEAERALVLFLGSNIGNFDREEAHAFLRALRGVLRAGDALLVGADLKKSPAALEAAYDDSLGVTAAFNLNILVRINREFDADFRPRDFQHVAVYNEEVGRVEMHLQSTRPQEVNIRALEMRVRFAKGERIHTENSYKYDLAELSQLAERAGFTLARTWLDRAEQFSSNLLFAT